MKLLRVIVLSAIATIFTTTVFATVFGGPAHPWGTPQSWIAMMIGHAILAAVIVRFGLLPAMFFTFARGLCYFPLTDDPSSWYVGYGLINAAIVLTLAAYGAYVSTGGRSLFNDAVLGEVQQN